MFTKAIKVLKHFNSTPYILLTLFLFIFIENLKATNIKIVSEKTKLHDLDFRSLKNTLLSQTDKADLEMIRRNDYFGYTEEEIQKHFSHSITHRYDFSHFNPSKVKKVPKPGIHPRVLFNPEEVPEIRKRLFETKPGIKIYSSIKKEIKNNLFNKGNKTSEGYQALIQGDTSVPIHKNISIAYGTLYEAFRCLIDDDETAGKEVAKAITTIAKIDQEVIIKAKQAYKSKNPKARRYDFRVTAKAHSQNGTLGLMYDWAYKWMDDKQRNIVREAIVTASKDMTLQGSETLRTPRSNSSNWISWTARLVCLITAIEGEEGYDLETYRRTVESMKWFFSLSIFPEGETMEGWGKQFLMAELAYIMARRGEIFFARENIRNVFRKYFTHALNPWGRNEEKTSYYSGPFTFYDSQGGTDTKIPSLPDVLVYKNLFPTDPAIDFIYRNSVGKNYKVIGSRVNFRHHFSTFDGFCKAIFAINYDESKSWNEAHKELTKEASLTYFSEDTGNMITRSSWDPKALYLKYLTRSIPGGHKYADRGHFSVYSQGRYWGIYAKMRQVIEAYWPKNRSTILIDNQGVSIAPGACLNHIDSEFSSFTVSDFKVSYDYLHNYTHRPERKDKKKSVMLPYTFNDFRIKPSDRPSWSLTHDMRPHWYDSLKKPYNQRMGGSNSAGWRKRDIPMKKAFRTAGMVRGYHPYILILDDIQKDNQIRNYEWGMTLANDVELNSTSNKDALLSEKGLSPDKSRFLLVRMLNVDGLDKSASIKNITSKNPPQKDTVIPKLVFNAKSKDPRFLTLICSVPSPNILPITKWSNDHSTLTIQIGKQVDTLRFKQLDSGRRIFSIERNGNIITNLLNSYK